MRIETFQIENSNFILKVSNYGATLVALIDKHNQQNLVLGYDDMKTYQEKTYYLGATVGRVCNRIQNGQFVLNEKVYQLPINNGPNSLHGGLKGFDKVIWDTYQKDNQIIFSHRFPHLDQGYPGNVFVRITYTLLDNGFMFETMGESDQDTLLSITNHSYFNFGDKDILKHRVKINSDCFGAVNQDGLSLEEVLSVDNTPFDFRESNVIQDVIFEKHPQLKAANGFDHHFIVSGKGLREMARLSYQDRTMIISSDLPGFHFYTGNFLEKKHEGLCFETQYYPNAINYTSFEKPILKKGEVLKHITKFEFVKGGKYE